MTASLTGLAILRANTDRFIAQNPTDIVLIPRTDAWLAGTKTRTDQTPRVSQTFKVIWSGTTGIISTIEGTTRRFDFVLVGSYDAIVAIGDHWEQTNQDNEIDYIFPYNGYEVKCGGTSYGSKPVA
jgi:hypothetical protein